MSSLRKLEAYEKENPGAIAIGHPDIVDSGRGIDPFTGEETRPKVNHRCPHCYPVLKTDGQFHACPFAIENNAPHFSARQHSRLAPKPSLKTSPLSSNWIDTVHEPYAIAHDLPACTVCWKNLEELPPPEFG